MNNNCTNVFIDFSGEKIYGYNSTVIEANSQLFLITLKLTIQFNSSKVKIT